MIEVTRLNKEYKNFSLNDVSFSVKKGHITGFIGNNGAGKTTVIKSILGLAVKDSGTITINNYSLEKNEVDYKESIGVVFDEGYYFDTFSIKRMKNIIANSYKNWDDKTFYDFLSRFKLDENQIIETLSKGMRMKFSLALALSHGADVLIFDEPSSGLDPKTRNLLCDIILEQKNKGKTIFFSTHITSDLDKIADDIILIDDGSIIFSKPVIELKQQYVNISANPTIEDIMLFATKGV